MKIIRRISRAFRPKRKISREQWARDNHRLSAKFGPPGPYDLDRFAYLREIFAAQEDPAVESISLMFGSQVGKSEFLISSMLANCDIDPAPALLVGPDTPYVVEMRDKIFDRAEMSPALRNRLQPPAKRNQRFMMIGDSIVYLGWSGSPQRVSGRACRRIYASEIDRFDEPTHEGDILSLIAERVKAFTRFCLIWESTPTDETSKIGRLYAASDRRRYFVPCPHCGHYQPLRFFPDRETKRGGIVGVKNDAGDWLSADEAAKTAYYACEKNGCRIDSEDKPGMIAAGKWVPAGQSITKRGKLTGTPEQSGRRRGYQLSSLYAPAIDFGRIAAKWIESKDNPTEVRNFYNNWLGVPYKKAVKAPKWDRLGRRLTGYHQRGTVPAGVYFLTAGVDVQTDRIYYVVRGWGEQRSSWRVDYGMIPVAYDAEGDPIYNSDLDALQHVLIDKRFPAPGKCCGGLYEALPVFLVGIDSGHDPARVWEFVRRFDPLRVRAVAGSANNLKMNELFRRKQIERNARTGEPYPGGMLRWEVNTDHYRSQLMNAWDLPIDRPGAWILDADPFADVDYLKQLTNLGRSIERDEYGRSKLVWKLINHQLDKHAFDCEVYAAALADMVTGMNFRPESLRRQFLIPAQQSAGKQKQNTGGFTLPDGTPYFVGDR